MVQVFCKLCLQFTPWVTWPTHITQKEHLQQLPLKIVVKGHFQDKIDEVYAYFGKFGGIRSQNVSVEGDLTAIEYRFWDARVYSEVVHSEHRVLDQDVEISWYKKPKSGPVEYVVQDERMQNEKFVYRNLAIVNETKDPPTFPEQLAVLLSKSKVIQDEMEVICTNINADLTNVLRPNFPNSKVHFFGSSLMNLALHNSDVNIYFDNTDSTEATLEQIKDSITNCDVFINVYILTKSDTLILKCQHKQSKTRCELSIKSEMPVGKTELLKFYLSLNDKLRVLILVVKFWASCHRLGLSGYALNLLVIFYLQQKPYNLPSVFDLQKDIPPDEIDGWNCAFGPVEFQESALENATVLELLTGFFQFYGNFDYISRVVCVFSGCGVDKTKFIKPYDLESCFETYLNQEKEFVVTAGLCVQDPFEHSVNVTSSTPVDTMGRLAAACRMSVELTSSEKELLYQLMLFPDNRKLCVKVEPDLSVVFKRVISKILTEICGCEVAEVEGLFRCRSDCNFWGNRPEVARNLSRDSHTSNIDYEAAITALVKNDSTPWSMDLHLKFKKGSKVVIEFSSPEHLSELPHIQHFIYLRLMETLSDRALLNKMKIEAKTPTVVYVEAAEIRAEDIKQELQEQFGISSQKEENQNSILDTLSGNSGKIEHLNIVEKTEFIEDQDSFISSSQIKMEVDGLSTDPLSIDLCDDDDEEMEVQCFKSNYVVDVDAPGTSGTGGVWPDASPAAPSSRLPAKSRKHYDLAYNQFKSWCATRNIATPTESDLLEYFSIKALNHKCTTMWAHYSMLKASMAERDNIEIRLFTRLTDFLKKNSAGYRPKTSKCFTRRDIERFLLGAPDKTYLLMKVALIMGIAGGCRRDELANMKVDDIEDTGSVLVVTIPKTDTDNERTFTIVGRAPLNMVDIYRKYAALRVPRTDHRRFFVRYEQGKCTVNPVGINNFGKIPSLIAKYLQLEDPSSYTGHCFRKSSATLRADAGIDIMSDIVRR